MKQLHASASAWIAVGTLVFFACGGKQPTAPPPTPRVKVEIVGEAARELTRQVAGRLESISKAALSFGVSGTVVKVLVAEGAAVSEGQLLAQLDSDEFDSLARSAESRLRAANAQLSERMHDLRRQEALLAEELVAPAQVDRLRADVEHARGEVRAAESDKVRRNLEQRQTRIVAPMDGRITRRSVDPFQEALANQTVFELAGAGGLQAVVRVPDTLVREIRYGQSATLRIPSMKSGELPGRVTEIAAQAGDGSAFRIAIALDRTPLDLRPGMAVNATFAFEGALATQTAYLIPISAFALQEMVIGDRERGEAEVFVYDEASATVKKRTIRGSSSIGNRIAVVEGLAPGDSVVVAGVAFLHDGMRVELWEPPH